jgi:ectoine hydroxylase-related dioxygenase (phytanoyl-CoA dioxygenase family)
MDGPLTIQQQQHYETFGFCTLRQCLTQPEMHQLDAEFEHKLDAVYAHAPFDDTAHQLSGPCLGDDTPFMRSLSEDWRFAGAAQQLYGSDVLMVNVDGFRYTSGFAQTPEQRSAVSAGLSPWHSDHGPDRTQDCYGMKACIYLDELRGGNGALRLVSGSHLEPLYTQLCDMNINADNADRLPSFVFETSPGDVLLFNMLCFHSSFGGGANRRLATVVFFGNPVGEAEEAACRERRGKGEAALPGVDSWNHQRATYEGSFIGGRPKAWLRNSEGSDLRAYWIRRQGELGFLGEGWQAALARL